VVCTIGDGAFQMMGMNGLATVKRHWEQWSNPTFIVLVIDNGDLNQVSWEMRIVGDPRWDTAQMVESMDYAGYGELLGFKGIRVNDPEDIDAALDEAFAADRPVVLNLKADPNTPPLPAHISMDQATGLAKSLIAGDPATGRVISQSLRAGAARLSERFGTSSEDSAHPRGNRCDDRPDERSRVPYSVRPTPRGWHVELVSGHPGGGAPTRRRPHRIGKYVCAGWRSTGH